MDENEVIVYTPVARLHDRWSLLAFTVSAVHDVLEVVTAISGVASEIALEHMRQKAYDRKFKEIVR